MSETPDPRFGMQAPLVSGTFANTPGGLTLAAGSSQSAVLSNPDDPFSIVTLTETSSAIGRFGTTVYDGVTRTFTDTTPEGRTGSYTIDSLGRVTTSSVPGLAGISATYDARGRLSTTTSGTGLDARTTTFTYNVQGYLKDVTDPIGRNVSFEYDAAGRVTKQTLPDLREILFAYDLNGNLTSLTPPGKPAHTFTYNEVDQAVGYTPPDLGVGSEATTYAYNLDQQPVTETRPDGLITMLAYDSAGRLDTIAPINAAANSKGSIHDDEKAREMGFRGGFVGGSTILAYMGRLMHENFGRAWIETGTLNGRLRRPVYEGGDVTVEGTIIELPSDANLGRVTVEMRVVTDDGEIGAIGSATCIPA